MTHELTRIHIQYFFSFLCILAVLTGAGCGKKGMPVPSDASQSFQWKTMDATAVGDCILFTGALDGRHENFSSLRLELAPINSPEDCPGCPFLPKEVIFFTVSDTLYNPDTGEINLTYCPTKAAAYRWRIAGVNQYTSLPHAMSPEGLLLMTE